MNGICGRRWGQGCSDPYWKHGDRRCMCGGPWEGHPGKPHVCSWCHGSPEGAPKEGKDYERGAVERARSRVSEFAPEDRHGKAWKRAINALVRAERAEGLSNV